MLHKSHYLNLFDRFYLHFEGGYLALGVGFLLTLHGDDLLRGAVDEFLVGEFLHDRGEEAFGILQLVLQFLQLGLFVDVLAHRHKTLGGANHEAQRAFHLLGDALNLAHAAELADDAVEHGRAIALNIEVQHLLGR